MMMVLERPGPDQSCKYGNTCPAQAMVHMGLGGVIV